MTGKLQQHVSPLDPDLLHPDALAKLGGDADLLILPARLVVDGGHTIAAFEPSTNAVRDSATRRGLRVELAAPPGTTPGVWEMRDATIWLPILMSVPAGVAANVAAALIVARVRKEPVGRVHYREVEVDADGPSALGAIGTVCPDRGRSQLR